MLPIVDRPCPYCGERLELSLDWSVSRQIYVEDCAVCCQPIVVSVQISGPDGEPVVTLAREAD